MAELKLGMRLFINTKTKSVVYAEAGKDCVDFLLGILSLPMVAVARILEGHGMAGCLFTMYQSFKNLSLEYTIDHYNKNTLLSIMGTIFSSGSSIPHNFPSAPDGTSHLFSCSTCRVVRVYHPNEKQTNCPGCGYKLSITYKGSGFVKETVTYMVTDDLEIKPMTTNSCISLLSKYNVKEFGDLEEREVHIGTDEALKLLKTLLLSKTVLTDVFIPKK